MSPMTIELSAVQMATIWESLVMMLAVEENDPFETEETRQETRDTIETIEFQARAQGFALAERGDAV